MYYSIITLGEGGIINEGGNQEIFRKLDKMEEFWGNW